MSDEQVTVQDARLGLTRKRRGAVARWVDQRGPQQARIVGRMVIGSTEQAALRVASSAVSRLHAEVELDDEGVWLHDLGSRNGTWLDHVRVERVQLRDDAHFQLGSVTIELTFERSPSSVPLWPEDHLGPLVGRSDAMRELFMQINAVAASDAPVLIRGETGTGKELVAQTVHDLSKRRAGPLVVVDCAALPESLLETELFGHTRGAFTGAVSAREGAIESAAGGTVLLDEVGELPLALQPRLLRALEAKTVRRLGQPEHVAVDVRFVAATHRELEGMVARGEFREDLYFRLAVLVVRVPPLRAHLDDLPALLERFLRKSGSAVPTELLATLKEWRWPGNARELRTFAERVAALGPTQALAMLKGGTSEPAQYPTQVGGLPPVDPSIPFKVLRDLWLNHLEREYLRSLLAPGGKRVAEIAELAGLDRSYVHRLMRKHNL